MKLLALWLVTLCCWAHARREDEVLSAALADNCQGVKGDVLTCLQLMVLANVSDIARTDEYQLADGMVVEKVNDLAPRDLTSDILRLDREKDVSLGNALLVRKTLDTFRSHVLHWRLLPGFGLTVFRHQRSGRWDLALEQHSTHSEEGRTFGARRRVVMIMLPIMYKLGVITAMLAGLVVITLKGLTVGVILLILAFSNVFKSKGYHSSPHWAPGPPLATDIHVHVHTDKEHGWESPSVHTGGWEPPSAHQEYQHHPYRRYQPYPYSFDPNAQA